MDPLFDRPWRNIRVSRNDAWVEIRIDRPAARNALDTALMEELTEAARLMRLRTDFTTVVLAGSETYFSAGSDLDGSRDRIDLPLIEARRAVMVGPDMCRAWNEIEAVTIAAVEGYCIGGACALALACDFRVLAEGAYLRLPEIPLGMNMSWRTLPGLTALCGPSRAKQFVMFGEKAEAQRCLDWGLADELAPKGQALAAARLWATKVAALPPLPVRMTKEAINAVAGAGAQASIYMDRDQFLLTRQTADCREGVAAFKEKRPAKFTGD